MALDSDPSAGSLQWGPPSGPGLAIFSSGCGNHGGAGVRLEGEGEDAHIHVEWKDRGSAGIGASWSGVWGPSPLRTRRSFPAQGLPTRGKGLRVEDRGLEEGDETSRERRRSSGRTMARTPAGQEGGIHPERQGTNQTPACGRAGAQRPGAVGVFPHRGAGARFTAEEERMGTQTRAPQ